ncbi:MAG: hypothetical protein D6737_04165 [Chloroflexi bacterium]|nr:MAG: hypothetical protein D6737_04165 [Chloroflexota bacterium]
MTRHKLGFVLFIIILGLLFSVPITGAQEETELDVTFFLNAIEIKGTTSADSLAPPEIDPTTLSAGYGFKAPGVLSADSPNDWQVASYMFNDTSLVVREGDHVGLNIFVTNGNLHDVWVESPSGEIVAEPVAMNRGREYMLEFVAEETGYYKLICGTHAPTMTSNILALPA